MNLNLDQDKFPKTLPNSPTTPNFDTNSCRKDAGEKNAEDKMFLCNNFSFELSTYAPGTHNEYDLCDVFKPKIALALKAK